MKHAFWLAFAFSTQAFASLPDGHAYDSSPSGTYLIEDDRDSLNPTMEDHHISIARRDHPKKFYQVYTFPRLYDLYFSPDEDYLVIDDHNGSGSNECVVLTRIDRPPYYAKPQKIDQKCWDLFWAQHKKPIGLTYTHARTYFCEWLDSSRFVVGLQGDQFSDPPKWSLSGGWHCIYDIRTGTAYTNEYTDSKNKKYELWFPTTSNRALQPTASRRTAQLQMIKTIPLQPRALSLAAAELVSR